MDAAQLIIEGKGYLGIEFGSTRIKAVLVDKSGKSISKDANGDYIGGYLSVKGTQTYASMGNIRLAKGTYYIKIYGSSSSEPYKLNVSKAKIKTPKISSVKSASYNSIKVKWKAVAGADQYYVYRSTSKKGKYKKIATIKKASTLTYKDKKSLKSKKIYYYKVVAYRTENGVTATGKASAIKSAKTK